MIPHIHMDDGHIIYGNWDDVMNDQFMVWYHPNGKHCSVFLFSGFDYGGGIDRCAEGLDANEVKAVINSHNPDADVLIYDVKKALSTMIATKARTTEDTR